MTPEGHYEYLKMPIGLVNAPMVFQRFINTALGVLRHEQVLVYIDDLSILSTVEEGLTLLSKVLEVLQQTGFKLKLSKCFFFHDKVDYLGHEISESGIAPSKIKTAVIKKFQSPTNVHEIRQFIGLAGYFRHFSKNFASIAFLLTLLTKKNEPWRWHKAQVEPFTQLQ